MAEYWYAPGSYTFPKAKAAIVRALEIDPSSAEARATLGNILLFCDWNWAEAEREIETAIRPQPEVDLGSHPMPPGFICARAPAISRARRCSARCSSSPRHRSCSSFWRGCFCTRASTGARSTRSRTSSRMAPIFRLRGGIARKPTSSTGSRLKRLPTCSFLPQDRAEDLALRLPLLGRAYADCGDPERAEGIYRTLVEIARTEYVVELQPCDRGGRARQARGGAGTFGRRVTANANPRC